MTSKIINKDNYNIHLYQTNRFKSNEIHVVFCHKRKKDDYLITALTTLLTITSKYYKTKRDRFIRSEELYNTSFNISKRRIGMINIVDFSISFIDPKLVEDDYLNDAIKYLFDILNNPIFDDNYLPEVKDKMNHMYKRRMENPATYAELKAYDAYMKDETINTKYYVDEGIVNTITMKDIKNKYNELINDSKLSVYAIGNLDDNISDIIDKYIIKNDSKFNIDDYCIHNNFINKPNKVEEVKPNINQAQIVMIYDTKEFDNYHKTVMNLYSNILGGGSLNSRLFNEVREKNQLCYNINSMYDLNESLLMIKTSVDNKNIAKTINLINKVVEEMSSIKNEELINAQANIKNIYESTYDYESGIVYQLIKEDLFGYNNIDIIISDIDKVSIDDLTSINDEYRLNTIYILKGE